MNTTNENNQTADQQRGSEPVPCEKIAVVIPMPNDPDWGLFDAIDPRIQIIVVDDSDGLLAEPPRSNVRMFDYEQQKEYLDSAYEAIPHKSAATRNFGHVVAYREGFEVIIALDYDCRTRPGWVEQHLGSLKDVRAAPALAGVWINSVEAPGFFARGYPYEWRNEERSAVRETTVDGTTKINMGVWDNVLDLNGIDKIQSQPPVSPGLRGEENYIALGNIPVCGMNTAFRSELTPAYFFLPDVWVNGTWQLSRHDDIWGGYILKKLMDLRGDLFSYGRPVVEHTRQSNLEGVLVKEHWMHLMSSSFYAIVDSAVERISPDGYQDMFGAFVDEFLSEVERHDAPPHYLQVYRELGDWMSRWVRCFA